MQKLTEKFTGYPDYVVNKIYKRKFMFLSNEENKQTNLQILCMNNGDNVKNHLNEHQFEELKTIINDYKKNDNDDNEDNEDYEDNEDDEDDKICLFLENNIVIDEQNYTEHIIDHKDEEHYIFNLFNEICGDTGKYNYEYQYGDCCIVPYVLENNNIILINGGDVPSVVVYNLSGT